MEQYSFRRQSGVVCEYRFSSNTKGFFSIYEPYDIWNRRKIWCSLPVTKTLDYNNNTSNCREEYPINLANFSRD